tara:strand:+ start:5475 stop:5609 length:135 start_codon:yes stop_codon:yes gene_type:complete
MVGILSGVAGICPLVFVHYGLDKIGIFSYTNAYENKAKTEKVPI